MDSKESGWESAVTMAFRPRLLLQGVVEYLMAWSFTRHWLWLFFLYAPVWLLLGTVVGLVSYGASFGNQTLVERYGEWVSDEIPEALAEVDDQATTSSSSEESAKTEPDSQPTSNEVAPEDATDKHEKITGLGDLLLRRLLQLQDSNSRITYLVAAQLARQGRLGQARQMMRRIAPAAGRGFPPAHAWLAVDQLQGQQIHTKEDRERLMKDLEIAAQWSGSGPALVGVYASLLERQGNVGQAMSVLEATKTADTDLEANLRIADMAARNDQKTRYDRAAQKIKTEIRKRMEEDTATVTDLTYLSNLFLIEKEPAKARQTAMMGLAKEADNPKLKRLLSESFRLEYLTTMKLGESGTQVNLALLDAALKADPSNPAVGAEIARLQSLGQDAPPELRSALKQQLVSGQTTALTHILLANQLLVEGNLTEAIPHLELALLQAPNTPSVMNNLALALARTAPDKEIDRATKLAVAAANAEPTSAEFRDTLGEIKAISGDKLGAVSSYETAIGLDGSRAGTRQRLATLYRELGMKEMAEVQEQELQKLSTQQP